MLGALIGGGLNVLGNVISNAQEQNAARVAYDRQRKLNEQQQQYNERNMLLQSQYNRQAAAEAFQREYDFWKESNDYNSPSAQMNRLREAGINPALAVGQLANTNSNMLDMSSPEVSAGSASAGSAPQARVNPLPDISNMLNAVKNLQLIDAQVRTQNAQAENIEANTEYTRTRNAMSLSSQPYWSENAKYDSEAKQYGSRQAYYDALSKLFTFRYMLPTQLQKLGSEIRSIDFQNDLNAETKTYLKSKRAAEVANLISQSKYFDASSLASKAAARNYGSQIGYRNWYMTQMNKSFEQQRSLQGSTEELTKLRTQVMSLQRDAVRQLSEGNYLDAIKTMTMLNFLSQSLNGSLFKDMPSPILGPDLSDMSSQYPLLRWMGTL